MAEKLQATTIEAKDTRSWPNSNLNLNTEPTQNSIPILIFPPIQTQPSQTIILDTAAYLVANKPNPWPNKNSPTLNVIQNPNTPPNPINLQTIPFQTTNRNPTNHPPSEGIEFNLDHTQLSRLQEATLAVIRPKPWPNKLPKHTHNLQGFPSTTVYDRGKVHTSEFWPQWTKPPIFTLYNLRTSSEESNGLSKDRFRLYSVLKESLTSAQARSNSYADKRRSEGQLRFLVVTNCTLKRAQQVSSDVERPRTRPESKLLVFLAAEHARDQVQRQNHTVILLLKVVIEISRHFKALFVEDKESVKKKRLEIKDLELWEFISKNFGFGLSNKKEMLEFQSNCVEMKMKKLLGFNVWDLWAIEDLGDWFVEEEEQLGISEIIWEIWGFHSMEYWLSKKEIGDLRVNRRRKELVRVSNDLILDFIEEENRDFRREIGDFGKLGISEINWEFSGQLRSKDGNKDFKGLTQNPISKAPFGALGQKHNWASTTSIQFFSLRHFGRQEHLFNKLVSDFVGPCQDWARLEIVNPFSFDDLGHQHIWATIAFGYPFQVPCPIGPLFQASILEDKDVFKERRM